MLLRLGLRGHHPHPPAPSPASGRGGERIINSLPPLAGEGGKESSTPLLPPVGAGGKRARGERAFGLAEAGERKTRDGKGDLGASGAYAPRGDFHLYFPCAPFEAYLKKSMLSESSLYKFAWYFPRRA